jgi:hypothetical protein
MQANTLLAQIKKARESKLTIGDYSFTIRRPTDYEAAIIFQTGKTEFEIAADYVCGWEGVKESDLLPSGGSTPVDFNASIWREWCADRPEFWAEIFDAVVAAWKSHRGEVDDAGKA